ncbi:hypothetical protein L1077_15620 [Pseudoalteromonas luteoviolacea]|uniref:hypothetical protein n=1 Tax=Pseudoalteromonas luteoviolacea TaxID=43657 RepID=UPI001F22D220|nr:hypothetical protein [Pseudoalteromonas luteoviolacea]MCF6440866.1 hypothetical protein [Pseudoalteromonas luteoviolacea]
MQTFKDKYDSENSPRDVMVGDIMNNQHLKGLKDDQIQIKKSPTNKAEVLRNAWSAGYIGAKRENNPSVVNSVIQINRNDLIESLHNNQANHVIEWKKHSKLTTDAQLTYLGMSNKDLKGNNTDKRLLSVGEPITEFSVVSIIDPMKINHLESTNTLQKNPTHANYWYAKWTGSEIETSGDLDGASWDEISAAADKGIQGDNPP